MATEISCDPADLMAASKCMKCIPQGMQLEVVIYILNEILGTGLTPDQLIENAKCFKCIPKGSQMEVIAYLTCQLVNAA